MESNQDDFSNDVLFVNHFQIKNGKQIQNTYCFTGEDSKLSESKCNTQIKKYIFYDDTINILLNKIALNIGDKIGDKDPNNYYIWSLKTATLDDIYKFLNIIFSKQSIIDSTDFNRLSKMYFDLSSNFDIIHEYNKDKKEDNKVSELIVTYDISKNILDKLMSKGQLNCYVNLLYSFTDTIYCTNPLKNRLSHKDTFQKFLPIPLNQNLIENFQLKTSESNSSNEINLITKEFFESKDEETIEEYFRSITKNVNKNIINITDNIVLQTQKLNLKDLVEYETKLHRVEISALPYITIDLNLNIIFDIFEKIIESDDVNIPVIVYSKKSANTIKISKKYFHNVDNEYIKKLTEQYSKTIGKKSPFFGMKIIRTLCFLYNFLKQECQFV